jgi:pimeloyl-ACP methyl ester carboxylesterase
MKTRFRLLFAAVTLIGLLGMMSTSSAQESTLRPDETVVTLDSGVVGTLLQPNADAPTPAVLMLHGFASVRDEVGDMYKRLAAELADYGIASLRIDFRGWGESAGAMTDSTVTQMVEDAAEATAYLQGLDTVDPERIGLIGFSLGGSVAVYSAGEHPDDYASMALWSTFGALHDIYVEEMGQETIDTAEAEGEVTVDLGLRMVTLGKGFFDSLDDYDYQAEFARYDGSLLVVAGSEDGSAEFVDWYRENAQGALKASYLIDGADHIYNVLTDDQTHADAAIEKTAGWFAMTL